MRNLVFIVFFLSFNAAAVCGQVIRGTVLDKQTHDRIPNALVYQNGTFVRTNADKYGKFVLDISKFSSMPLVISAPGYYSTTISILTPEQPVVISLKSKPAIPGYEADNSSIDGKKRKENMRIFRNIFLGTTPNAHHCSILNENDLIVISDPADDTLKAFSSKPLILENSALGYEAIYYLDGFEYIKKSKTFLLTGNICFEQDLSAGGTDKDPYLIKRKQAYHNSSIYFFRSLWKNTLDSAKIRIKSPKDEFLDYDQVVYQTDSMYKYLRCPVKVMPYAEKSSSFYIVFNEADVEYDKNGIFDPSSVSLIYPEKDICFDKAGYFDPAFVSWQGKLAEERIGDLLPYEYMFE
jgi:hypothetical protein